LDLITAQQQHMPATGCANPQEHYERARNLCAAHIDGNALVTAPARPSPTPAALIQGASASWTPLQASIDKTFQPESAGIAVIVAPTGEGKTEAGLLTAARFARACGRHGFFFAMPTVATAEGLHGRIQRYIDAGSDDTTVQRVHSQASLFDDTPNSAVGGTVSEDTETQRAASAWMTGTRKTMLAPYGVGTVDQVLLGALRAKHSPLRMLAAASGCVIVDEAHALDPYMRILLCRSVEWFGALATPVVVLSATMPTRRTRELFDAYQRGAGCEPATTILDGYPSWAAWTPTDGWSGSSTKPRRRWTARLRTADVPAAELTNRIAQQASAAASDGRCVLIVRSTVRAAQETHDALSACDASLVPGTTLQIVHSRMPHRDRRSRSETLLRLLGPDLGQRPRKMVVVATQVVEQSFDVDFDLAVSDPAPASALLQRLGRVRRHRPPSVGEAAEMVVVWPCDTTGAPRMGSLIYSKADLMAARAWLTDAETSVSVDVDVPDAVPGIVARADTETTDTFVFDAAEEEAADATLAQLARMDAEKALGHRWAIPFPSPEAPLADLTGTIDTEEVHPGTRHQARSVLVIPATRDGGKWLFANGTTIDSHPARPPARRIVREAFDHAVPVSYPNSDWVALLPQLTGGWDRTPVAGALLLDQTGDVTYGDYVLRQCPHTGLSITRATTS
jgi:CRISPR-associated endonuclease/helicase Cas3